MYRSLYADLCISINCYDVPNRYVVQSTICINSSALAHPSPSYLRKKGHTFEPLNRPKFGLLSCPSPFHPTWDDGLLFLSPWPLLWTGPIFLLSTSSDGWGTNLYKGTPLCSQPRWNHHPLRWGQVDEPCILKSTALFHVMICLWPSLCMSRCPLTWQSGQSLITKALSKLLQYKLVSRDCFGAQDYHNHRNHCKHHHTTHLCLI